MEKKYCIKCGLELYPEERECPECGTPAPRERRPLPDEPRREMKVESNVEDGFEIPKKKLSNTKPSKKLKLKSKFLKGLIISFSIFIGFVIIILLFGEEQEPDTMVTIEQKNIQEVQIDQAKHESDINVSGSFILNDDSEIIDMDYIDLWRSYTDEDYKGKKIRIAGKVSSVSNDGFVINEELEGLFNHITLDFKENSGQLNSINPGDYVLVTAKCKQKIAGYLYLEDCFVEDTADAAYNYYNEHRQLRIEQDEINKEIHNQEIADEMNEYKANAITVDYQSLVREPYNYEGDIIKVTIKVSQVMSGGILTESGYSGKQNGNEWYITYSLPEGTPRILEGDTVTFYGEFNGLREMRRALTGVKDEIPNLKAKYHE